LKSDAADSKRHEHFECWQNCNSWNQLNKNENLTKRRLDATVTSPTTSVSSLPDSLKHDWKPGEISNPGTWGD
jgi:hypothetical protein